MDCVYNVVLSTGHVIVINGLQFITLGHGVDDHPVLAHAFFGTQVSGWALWHVKLLCDVCHVTRDAGRRARDASERQRPGRRHGVRRRQARVISQRSTPATRAA